MVLVNGIFAVWPPALKHTVGFVPKVIVGAGFAIIFVVAEVFEHPLPPSVTVTA